MDNGVLLETKTLVELIRHYIRDQVRVFSVLGCSRKDPYSPHGGNFCRPEGEGRKNCF